ncbi:MAG: protein translocase subunit SecF [Deltaproteobacteria bacterium]|nr:protein translocase subunit SecF [Deltaproteobacteria bacterium]
MEFNRSHRVYDFMAVRKYWIAFSIAITIVSAILLIKPGPKYGIDFMGGTELTVQFDGNVDAGRVRAVLDRMGHEHSEVVPTQRANEYIIRVEKSSPITAARREQIRRGVAERLPGTTGGGTLGDFRLSPGGDHIVVQFNDSTLNAQQVAELLRASGANVRGDAALQMGALDDHRWQVPLVGIGDEIFRGLVASDGVGAEGQLNASVWVSPKAGAELRYAALRAVAYSIVFIMIYVAFRFDLRFAPGGILALVHDSMVTLGFFVITRKEVTISTVAAILTVVGYSMNDTIIVYDRIRENLAKRRNARMLDVINLSVSEMLSRTILTSLTVVLSVSAFIFIGTGVIRDFAWAMIIGVLAGTYSSIYVAAPFTEWIDSRFFHDAHAASAAEPPASDAKTADV